MYYGEKFNAMTHVVGAVLALAGAVALVALAALGGDPWKMVSVAIYGVTLVSLYRISGLYHSLRGRRRTSCASWTTRASTCSSPAATPRSAW
jgi:hemolysin III